MITVEVKVLLCAIRHSAWVLTRFGVQADGRTPFQRLHQKPYNGGLVEFCECVFWRDPASDGSKLETKWGDGLWVGKVESSDEHIVLTKDGVQKVRAIRRKEESERFSKDLYDAVRELPWSLSGTLHDTIGKERRRYITRAMIEEHGKTPGCPACNKESSIHSTGCKARFERIFEQLSRDKEGTVNVPKVGILAGNAVNLDAKQVDPRKVKTPSTTTTARAVPEATEAERAHVLPEEDVGDYDVSMTNADESMIPQTTGFPSGRVRLQVKGPLPMRDGDIVNSNDMEGVDADDEPPPLIKGEEADDTPTSKTQRLIHELRVCQEEAHTFEEELLCMELINAAPETEDAQWKDWDDGECSSGEDLVAPDGKIYGALSGKLLDIDMVREGRRFEMERTAAFGVVELRPKSEAKGKKGREAALGG